MYSGVKPVMTSITEILEKHFSEKQRQWIWFVLLWCFGLLCVMSLGMIIRLLMAL